MCTLPRKMDDANDDTCTTEHPRAYRPMLLSPPWVMFAIVMVCALFGIVTLIGWAQRRDESLGVHGKPPLEYGSVLIDGERSKHNYVYGGENVCLHDTQYVVTFFEDDLFVSGEKHDRTMIQTNLWLRGAFKTSSLRFVLGESEVLLDDHILLCEPGSVVRLGDLSTTPDGMRLIVRPMDTSTGPCSGMSSSDMGTGLAYACTRQPDYPVVSCLDSGCMIDVEHSPSSLDMAYVHTTTEYVFYAARNTWFAL